MMKMNQEIEPISINTGNDEESFVILESSKNQNSNSLMCDRSISWQPSLIQSTDYVSSPMESSQTHIQNQKFSMCLSSMNMSPEDIQKKLHDVLKENVELKETLHQNNMAMKEQFSTLQTWQEEVLKVQKNHKEKFAETKTLILKLKADNQELRKGISGNMSLEKIKKLEEENNKLSTQITMLQEKLENQIQKEKRLFSQMQPSTKETELHNVVEQLTHQLEVAERARRQQTIDIERLTVQLSRTHNQLMSSQQQLTETQVTGNAVTKGKIDLDSRCQRYDQLIDQLSNTIKKETERIVSMDTWIQMTLPSNNLQLEITELRKLLTEEQVQSVTRKENLNIALSSFQELLIDFKAVIQEMESLKEDIIAKEKHNKQYESIQKRTFREKIDSLTAQLVGKEEALAISERNLSSLQECIRLESENKGSLQSVQETKILKNKLEELGAVIVSKDQELTKKCDQLQELHKSFQKIRDENELLKSQVSVYQTDFEAERRSREDLVSEKTRLQDDLRHLQRRNKEILDELRMYQDGYFKENQRNFGHEQTPSPPKPFEEEVPPPKRFYCPNPECTMIFTTVEPLELHVGDCLNLKD